MKGYSEDGALAMAEDQLATIRLELGGARLVHLALRGSRSTSSTTTTTTTTVEGSAESPSPLRDLASGEEPWREGQGYATTVAGDVADAEGGDGDVDG